MHFRLQAVQRNLCMCGISLKVIWLTAINYENLIYLKFGWNKRANDGKMLIGPFTIFRR